MKSQRKQLADEIHELMDKLNKPKLADDRSDITITLSEKEVSMLYQALCIYEDYMLGKIKE